MTLTMYLIAGEPSGDRLGAGMMRALKAQAPGVRFSGIGGPAMAAEGLESLFPMSELSVMGIAEVIPRLPALLRRIGQTAGDVLERRPDALITIDSPGFCLRVAGQVRARAPGIRTVHYVAPSVWAWRPGRARRMARYIDHVLALLPFEPPWMTAAGMGCDFVGHPAAARVPASAADVAAMRARAGAGDGAPLLLLAPGSRAGEIGRMMPVFAEVVRRVAAVHPGLRLVVPVEGAVAAEVRAAMAEFPALLVGPEGGEAAKHAAMAAADAALVTSGTVVLEVAAAGVAMVSAYRMSAVTGAIVRRLARVETGNLVNLVSGTTVVPEFLQQRCTAGLIAPEVCGLLSDPARREAQRAAFGPVLEALGRGGEDPSARAAGAVLRVVMGPQARRGAPPSRA